MVEIHLASVPIAPAGGKPSATAAPLKCQLGNVSHPRQPVNTLNALTDFGRALMPVGDADDRLIYFKATGKLFYDANGGSNSDAVLFAILDNHSALTAADFAVIA